MFLKPQGLCKPLDLASVDGSDSIALLFDRANLYVSSQWFMSSGEFRFFWQFVIRPIILYSMVKQAAMMHSKFDKLYYVVRNSWKLLIYTV